ncbi:Scr1 family TA system antitoxin-like transcriptional regulator [Streptomyces prasinus]|uniref:Scr1 family TA system antitoxin-like transcriptional regulator n=1 Tax=Streptomyces prasinus TaxID=67345 RepID=UPI00369D42A5
MGGRAPGTGAAACARPVTFLLMSFPRATAQDLVLTDAPTGNFWMEQEAEATYYRALFDDARTVALPPTESLALVRRTAEEFPA